MRVSKPTEDNGSSQESEKVKYWNTVLHQEETSADSRHSLLGLKPEESGV